MARIRGAGPGANAQAKAAGDDGNYKKAEAFNRYAERADRIRN